MLQHITLKHFILVDALTVDLSSGFTAITGETGSGKSILLQAIELCLGKRCDNSVIQPGQDQCELNLLIRCHPSTHQWLQQQDLMSSDDDICCIRRLIHRHGHSKIYFNQTLVTQQWIRQFAERALHIHGQHANQALLKPETQRRLLDHVAQHHTLHQAVADTARAWQQTQKAQADLKASDHDPRILELLDYHIEELEQHAVSATQYQQWHTRHRWLAQSTELRQALSAHRMQLGDGESNILAQLQHMIQTLTEGSALEPTLQPALQALLDAQCSLEDAHQHLRDQLNHQDDALEELQQLEAKLDTLFKLSRKHQVPAHDLADHLAHIQQQRAQMSSLEQTQLELEAQAEEQRQQYRSLADQLTQSRQQAAAHLDVAVNRWLQQLGMKESQFVTQVTPDPTATPNSHGQDQVNFTIKTHPSQPLRPLAKVASGGENARINLALQVVTAQQFTIPTLIFDEVDTGISGPTAATVGHLLQTLGQSTQVLAITHLPQVAASAHQHLQISKQPQAQPQLSAECLSPEQRIQALAHMLGGHDMTPTVHEHAKQLLLQSQPEVASS